MTTNSNWRMFLGADPSLAFSTQSYVTYSCGSCGYDLNLSSCNRNTTKIGSKYSKAIKKGIISFFSVDESKFRWKYELYCKPYFSKSSWGLFQHRSKLMCRKCGFHIGDVYHDRRILDKLKNAYHISRKESCGIKYNIKIGSIQPSD